ncbi:hypothetical protein ZHAS_00003892 [Anopheles sinensis]|uniref:Uncharacterized protein n=1 Tax=Anopheles sinensis TaxID=74873 RepID=A0A084VFI1_ANOSI|nr:hypothetical protein ZHAS_00003892 [Anopheles sinensis]
MVPTHRFGKPFPVVCLNQRHTEAVENAWKGTALLLKRAAWNSAERHGFGFRSARVSTAYSMLVVAGLRGTVRDVNRCTCFDTDRSPAQYASHATVPKYCGIRRWHTHRISYQNTDRTVAHHQARATWLTIDPPSVRFLSNGSPNCHFQHLPVRSS